MINSNATNHSDKKNPIINYFITKRIVITMKLIIIISFVLSFSVAASSYSQTKSLNIDVTTPASVKSVLKMIEEQSNYRFFYTSELADLDKTVTVSLNDKNIFEVLNSLFDGTSVGYRVLENNFVVLSLESILQGNTVTGTIIDTYGDPLPGVTVMVKGTTTGTASDAKGAYTLQVPDGDATLVFSFVGFLTQEIRVGEKQNINITLLEDTRILEEVVVVGYGTQKKVNLTGAVAVVSGQDITSKAATDVLSAMQGQLPGVTILRNSGKPGSEISNIRIRGFTSVNDASALVLIDGVEGSLQTLNAEDIESISVLKDAASASIYGARAAAGVILVTTKKGAVQHKQVSYNGSYGINVANYMMQIVYSWEQMEMENVAWMNRNNTINWAHDFIEQMKNPNIKAFPNGARWRTMSNTDWVHEGTKQYTTQQTHSVSTSGGNEKTTYYVSGGLFTKNGILKYAPDEFNRINLRASMNTELSKYLDFNMNISYTRTMQKETPDGSENAFGNLYNIYSRMPIYNPEEDINYANNPWYGDATNPIFVQKEGGEARNQYQYFTGNALFRIKNVVKNLTLDLNVSRTAGFSSNQVDRPRLEMMGRNSVRSYVNNPQNVRKVKSNSYQDKLEALLNYELRLSNHYVHILAGTSYEQYLNDYISATARNGVSNDFFSFNFYDNGVASNSVLSDAVQPWKMASLFGRVKYEFAERYLLEATLRYDGSSRLAPGNRWGLFPSVSAGWRISEETFFKDAQKVVSNLKLRASWGQLGNSTVLNSMYYPYIGFVSSSTFWGNPTYYQNSLVSKDVTWETITATNLGVDMGFLNNRLNATADYYWKKNDGMLAQLRVGNIIGLPGLPYENAGILKTWGWELSLQWRDRIGDLAYQLGFNLDDSQNKLIEYIGVNGIGPGRVSLLEGYSLNTVWGFETNGFWQSRQEYLDYKAANPGYESYGWDDRLDGGDVKYVAKGKADHKIGIGGGTPEDSGDLILLGDETPHYLYGFNLGLQWKGFDFSMFLQGVGKRKFFLNMNTINPVASSAPLATHHDYWTEDNPNAYFARLVMVENYNYQPSDRWLQNGAYMRLKNIQLGYTIPIPKKIIPLLRIYVTGTDLWEHTNTRFKGFDPEVSNNIGRASFYPFFRTCTMGINVTF